MLKFAFINASCAIGMDFSKVKAGVSCPKLKPEPRVKNPMTHIRIIHFDFILTLPIAGFSSLQC